jgi:hypothetical protein
MNSYLFSKRSHAVYALVATTVFLLIAGAGSASAALL